MAAIEVIDDEALLANVVEQGARLRAGLEAIDGVAEVRGRGLMIGLTLADGLDAPAVRDRLLDAGLLLNCPGPGILRLLPPLIVSSDQVDQGVSRIAEAISASLASLA